MKRIGDHHYGFIHASFAEYFATRAMYEEIQEQEEIEEPQRENKDKEEKENGSESTDTKKPKGGIHERVFSKERQTIQFMADRVEMSKMFKQKMLSILESSKNDILYSIGAANAITVLVRAGVTFNGKNLSGIKVSGADISGGFFDQADLSNANLNDTKMRNVRLCKANLDGCLMEGVNFGEYPSFAHKHPVHSFKYREDTHRLLIAGDEIITQWDTNTGEKLKTFDINHYMRYVTFDSTGDIAVHGNGDHQIRIIDLSSGEIGELLGHEGQVECISISPTGNYIASGSNDNAVRIWSNFNQDSCILLKGHENSVDCLQFSHDGELLASGSNDHSVRIWFVSTAKIKCVFTMHTQFVACIAFSQNRPWVISGSESEILIWEMNRCELIYRLEQPSFQLLSIAFSSNSEYVLCSGRDEKIMLYEVMSGKKIDELRGHNEYVSQVSFSLNGDRIISGSYDGTVRFWEFDKERISVRAGHNKKVDRIAFSLNGELVISLDENSSVRIWETMIGKSVKIMQIDHISGVAFNADGEFALLAGNSSLGICEVKSQQDPNMTHNLDDHMYGATFSSDGNWVAYCIPASDEIIIREVGIWKVKARLQCEKSKEINCLSFSPNGDRVVAGSASEQGFRIQLRIWNISNGNMVSIRPGHEGFIRQAIFSPDGESVLSVSQDSIRICNIKSARNFRIESHRPMKNGKDMVVIKGNKIQRALFSPDATQIISLNENMVQVWNISDAQCVNELKLFNNANYFSYHSSGHLIIGFTDGCLECYQNLGKNRDYKWQLRWSSDKLSSILVVDGLSVKNALNLDDQNRRMLEQRGAIVDEKVELHSNALSKVIVQRAGSPIHRKPDSPHFQQNQTVVDLSEDDQEFEERSDSVIAQHNDDRSEEINDMEKDKKECHCCVII